MEKYEGKQSSFLKQAFKLSKIDMHKSCEGPSLSLSLTLWQAYKGYGRIVKGPFNRAGEHELSHPTAC